MVAPSGGCVVDCDSMALRRHFESPSTISSLLSYAGTSLAVHYWECADHEGHPEVFSRSSGFDHGTIYSTSPLLRWIYSEFNGEIDSAFGTIVFTDLVRLAMVRASPSSARDKQELRGDSC